MHQLQLCATQVGRLAERCCPMLTCACWGCKLECEGTACETLPEQLLARVLGARYCKGGLGCVQQQAPQRAEAHGGGVRSP